MADAPNPETGASNGSVTISDSVVAKVAHNACHEIEGVHALGGAASRSPTYTVPLGATAMPRAYVNWPLPLPSAPHFASRAPWGLSFSTLNRVCEVT